MRSRVTARLERLAAGALLLTCSAAPAAGQLRVVEVAPLGAYGLSTERVVSARSGRAYDLRIWEPLPGHAKGPLPTIIVLGREDRNASAVAQLAASVEPRAAVRVVGVSAAAELREPGDFLHVPYEYRARSDGRVIYTEAAGDAPALEAFLTGELVPLLTRRFGGAAPRALFGERFAATFVLRMAAESPGSFEVFAADGPMLTGQIAHAIAEAGKPPPGTAAAKLLIRIRSDDEPAWAGLRDTLRQRGMVVEIQEDGDELIVEVMASFFEGVEVEEE